MDEPTIFNCEHIEKGKSVEWRAIPVGEGRFVAICKECNNALLGSLLPEMIRDMVRDELRKAMSHA